VKFTERTELLAPSARPKMKTKHKLILEITPITPLLKGSPTRGDTAAEVFELIPSTRDARRTNREQTRIRSEFALQRVAAPTDKCAVRSPRGREVGVSPQ